MNIFIGASAVVAMLALEENYEELGDRLDAAERRMTSAMAIWEATNALSLGRGIMMDIARQDVANFIDARGVAIVPIGDKEADAALDAHRRYGRDAIRHGSIWEIVSPTRAQGPTRRVCSIRAMTSRERT